jgi:hypothetical protein
MDMLISLIVVNILKHVYISKSNYQVLKLKYYDLKLPVNLNQVGGTLGAIFQNFNMI